VGDLPKANELLSELQQSDNAFTPRARIWQIVLAGGMARGYAELADGYVAGGRINRADALEFHKQAVSLRAMASHCAMDFTQAVHAFLSRDPSVDVQLGFDLPPGTAGQPILLRKPYGGTMPIDSEVRALETAMIEYDVIRAICQANGTESDSPQMVAKFKAEVMTPRVTFLWAAARTLFDVSAIYNYDKLDEPRRFQAMCQEALAALQSIPATDETKAMTKKIQAALKKAPGH
jgi:hypothetical protein